MTFEALFKEIAVLPVRHARALLPFAAVQMALSFGMSLVVHDTMAPVNARLAAMHGRGTPQEIFSQLGGGLQSMLGWVLVLSALAYVSHAGYLQVFGDALHGRTRTPGARWGAALRSYPLLLIATFAWTVATFIGAMLCCLPGVAAMVLFCTAPAAVVVGGCGPLDALGESWRRVSRRFWLVTGLELLLVAAGSAVALALATAALPLRLLAGELPVAAVNGLPSAALGIWQVAMSVVIYVRLRAAEGEPLAAASAVGPAAP